ncbi:Alpha/Beta hydrolase protein [Cantharellus anzutake]|uniref:Alpha/Beta hydrolase protein n=1 Tax=Cantharellus anzutake TaxID=1750568 RepID=UPI0019039CE1|nr:Alpha/Beta hydrolase protein [Cantharellus anzutake]KAF8324587.1 Alpha/Beta hydrolase protein [Cantharellus anzutake]
MEGRQAARYITGVIFIHGWSVPSPIYKDIVDILALEGFRVLVFDLYGRGYSDSPDVPESPLLYVTQVALLMQYLGWTRARVVGVSMGAGISATLAARLPHLIDNDIVFICAAGNLPANYHGRIRALLTTPPFVWLSSTKLIRTWKQLPDPPLTPDDKMKQLLLLQARTLPHYGRVLASSLRRGPVKGITEAYRTVGKSTNRALIIHGTEDTTTPYHPFADPILRNLLPKAKLVAIENVGHDLTVTRPKEVAEAILAFFNAEPEDS